MTNMIENSEKISTRNDSGGKKEEKTNDYFFFVPCVRRLRVIVCIDSQ